MAQYQPGWEPEPEPEDLNAELGLTLLSTTYGKDHPDFLALARELIDLHQLGFDTNTQDTLDMARALMRVRDAKRANEIIKVREHQERIAKASIVYYMQMRDLIKIGTTTSPVEVRRAQLMADKVLATEPGSHELEKQRHRQFEEYRYTGERFFPGEPLLAHIDSLRASA
jgi:hypothetical protein